MPSLSEMKATRLALGEAIIELAEVRKPCGSLTKLDQRLPKRLYQRAD